MTGKKGDLKYKDLTKDILFDRYMDKGMSTISISEEFNIPEKKTINEYLKRFGIPVRNHRDAAIVKYHGNLDFKPLDQEQKEIIIGELLGDGNITIDARCNNAYPYYRHSSKHKEYLEWLTSKLPSLKWNDVTKTVHSQINKNGERIVSYRLNSQVHPELKALYDMFYDENGNKHIPKDIKLTPIILRQWFLGDGTYGLFSAGKDRKTGQVKKSWQMAIYACAFSKNELESIVVSQLKDLGIEATVTMGPGKHRIRISSKSHERFFDYVGQCPIECYFYKFKR